MLSKSLVGKKGGSRFTWAEMNNSIYPPVHVRPTAQGLSVSQEARETDCAQVELWAGEIFSELKRKPFVWCSSPWKTRTSSTQELRI